MIPLRDLFDKHPHLVKPGLKIRDRHDDQWIEEIKSIEEDIPYIHTMLIHNKHTPGFVLNGREETWYIDNTWLAIIEIEGFEL